MPSPWKSLKGVAVTFFALEDVVMYVLLMKIRKASGAGKIELSDSESKY